MKAIRLYPAIATLLALAFHVSAQTGGSEPVERIGLDISGLGTPKTVPVAAPVAPVAKPDRRPKGPTEITARDATFDNRIHLATFTTEVQVRDPEFGLSCDRLTVNLKKPPVQTAGKAEPKPKSPGGQGSGIEKAIAEGNVIITQEKADAAGKLQRYTGRAKRAVFDNKTGTLTLYGSPQISESVGGAISKQIVAREEGCVITLDRAGKIDVKGYHVSTLQDSADLNQAPR